MRGRAAAFLCLATLVGGCAEAGDEAPRPGTLNAPSPEYAAATLDGDTVSLASLRGSPVLLNVWATWCAPCRKEMPELQALHEEWSQKGLRIVGVSIDATGAEAAVREFTSEYDVAYTILHDPQERVVNVFAAPGVPLTVLIDRSGTVRWRHLGPVHADSPTLRRVLEEAMAAAP